MNRLRQTASALLAAVPLCLTTAMLASCSEDNGHDVPQPDITERVALRVTGGIETRAAGNEWTVGDAIGIYMLNGDDDVDTYANVKYVTQSGGTAGDFHPAEGAETIYLPVDGTGRDFVAYYPYSSSPADGVNTTRTIDLSDQSDQTAIDFMAAVRVKDKDLADSSVPFVFFHKLAKIEITIQPGVGIWESDLEGMTVTLTGQPMQGTYDMTADGGEVIPSSTTGTMPLLTTADGTRAEGTVFPSTNFNGMYLIFSTRYMGDYSWALHSSTRATRLEAGKRYRYTITVDRTELEVTATITDWAEGNGTGDTGSAE